MPSIYDIKPAFQRLLRPLVGFLAGIGVSANQVTLAAAGLSALTGAWIIWLGDRGWPLLAVPVVLFVRMALNAIDGMLAREHKMVSRLGAMLNELGDVISDTALYLPLALVPGFPAWLVVSIVIASILNEFAGVLAIQVGAERRYDGPMGKSDRAFAFGTICLVLGVGVAPGNWLTIVLGVILALAVLTIWNRASKALQVTPAQSQPID